MGQRSATAEPTGPTVSVIALSYNQERFVEAALDSIRSQDYPHVHLIIVDDGSTDGSVDRIRRWLDVTQTEATLIVHPRNMGVCRSLNDALRLAVGEFVAMLAADDIWLPGMLTRHVIALRSAPPEVGVVFSDAFHIDEAGARVEGRFMTSGREPRVIDGAIFEELLLGNFIPAMTTLTRRECFEKVGSYDESLLYEDWDMWLRIARRYRFSFSSVVSAEYRIVSSSLTRTYLMVVGSPEPTVNRLRILRKWVHDASLTTERRNWLASEVLNAARFLYDLGDRSELAGGLWTVWVARTSASRWLCFKIFLRCLAHRAWNWTQWRSTRNHG